MANEINSVRLFPPQPESGRPQKNAREYAYPKPKGKVRWERALLGVMLVAMLAAGMLVYDGKTGGAIRTRINDAGVTEVFSQIGHAIGGKDGVVSAFSEAVKDLLDDVKNA